MHAVVVTFDSLPVSCLGCYGNMASPTPHFDALAAQSVVFDACYAGNVGPRPGGWSSPLGGELHAAGITCIGVDDPAWNALPDSGTQCLVELQWRAVASPWQPSIESLRVEEGDGWSWDLWEAGLRLAGAEQADAEREMEPAGRMRAGLPQLAAAGLLQRNAVQEHPELAPLLRSMFTACVRDLDTEFGTWLENGAQQLEGALLIVTARRGELLFPHPRLAEGCPAIVDPIVRVPLIIRRPECGAAGTRRAGIVSHADVAATLLEWFDLQPRPMEGRSLLPVLRGETESVRELVHLQGESGERGMRTPEFSLLTVGQVEEAGADADNRYWLFRKPEDAWDVLDVGRQFPEELERLAGLIDRAAEGGQA